MGINQNGTLIRSLNATRPVNRTVARIDLEGGISIAVKESNLPFRIGRDLTSDFRISSGHVSRNHCELYLINGNLCLKDTSKNGTLVADKTIKQESMSIKSAVTVCLAGDTRFKITPVDPDSASEGRRLVSERRGAERRQEDRRQQCVVVKFERRSEDNRRLPERRVSTER